MTQRIVVEQLSRSFTVVDREPGLRAALRSLVDRRTRTIDAVTDVSFTVDPGEVVGFLGPNGAGKTTTLKCVAGLLTPSAGRVEALGHVPSAREPDYLGRLGFVMGQRWQLHVDLPVEDSFEVLRVIYGIDAAEHARHRDELVELLDLGPLLRQPFRGLSLGQRMRCEFAAAVLHRPDILLLDEPTLGLDFDAQAEIRRFVRDYVDRTEASVLLTSHYLVDVESLSDRVITIARGRLTFTGTFEDLRARAGDRKHLTVRLRTPIDPADAAVHGRVLEQTDARLVLEVDRERSGPVISELQQMAAVIDVSLADPPIEETLADLYARDDS